MSLDSAELSASHRAIVVLGLAGAAALSLTGALDFVVAATTPLLVTMLVARIGGAALLAGAAIWAWSTPPQPATPWVAHAMLAVGAVSTGVLAAVDGGPASPYFAGAIGAVAAPIAIPWSPARSAVGALVAGVVVTGLVAGFVGEAGPIIATAASTVAVAVVVGLAAEAWSRVTAPAPVVMPPPPTVSRPRPTPPSHRLGTPPTVAQLRRDAAAADRTKTAFLETMTHELRTPLNVIAGNAQLLRAETDADARERYLDAILASNRHLLGLIEDVLTLSRQDEEDVADLQPTELGRVFADLHTMFRPRARRSGLVLKVDIDPRVPPVVDTDERRLRQILINLVANALKFTAEGGVDVQATWGGGTLRVEVTDSGPGIPAADRQAVFEPFVQLEAGRASGQGAGLGLAISRRFARALGGDLVVDPGYEGGARFVLTVSARNAEGAIDDPYPTGELPVLIPADLASLDPVVRTELIDALALGDDLRARDIAASLPADHPARDYLVEMLACYHVEELLIALDAES